MLYALEINAGRLVAWAFRECVLASFPGLSLCPLMIFFVVLIVLPLRLCHHSPSFRTERWDVSPVWAGLSGEQGMHYDAAIAMPD